ncbi:MAG: single-stranded-DNA-specific exonuclease RecJ [Coriobacteriales bacterium]|jgi:single-stranded-DNA-specific exonuclease
MKSNWEVKPTDERAIESLCEELQIPRLLAAVLACRGFADVEKARAFLNPSLERDWNDPLVIPGMSAAVDVIEDAVRKGRSTMIFGDFDVDGITATSVMLLGLRAFGLEVRSFIPRRQDEGYGLSREALDRIMNAEDDGQSIQTRKPELIVTVDCGITSAEEVAYARELGLDVVVTDHHNPLNSVPQGVPVCNPRLEEGNPSENLAGVGVALKVIQELGRRFGKPDVWKSLIDLAALGTIADRMPLFGENRALVSEGVKLINESPRPGIAASLAAAGDLVGKVDAVNLSFSIIPRLNAAGRMADAQLALDLLLCDDPVKAQGLSKMLEDVNVARREAEVELSDAAEKVAEEQYSDERVLVLADSSWHEGVKGIVASRLANKFGVPTILFTIEGDEAHGSGRSVGKVDLFEAIESVKDLTIKFGGHKYAAGVTVAVEDIPEFRRRLAAYFAEFPDEAFEPTLEVDAQLDFEDLTMDQVGALSQLEPFGQENPEPLFVVRGAFIGKARAVGAKKNHLSFSITNGAENATAIYFHCDDAEGYAACSAPVDLVFSAQIEEWRGRRQLKLKVKDMEMALDPNDCCGAEAQSFVDGLFEQDHHKMVCRHSPTVDLGKPSREECANWSMPTDGEAYDGSDISEEICVALSGRNLRLHNAQRIALENLEKGKSTLAVMATGRGKSLIFYAHAAKEALFSGKQSIFVFPLRALINDQAFHIGHGFARLGLTVQTLTGETPLGDRASIYEAWDAGEVDVILTTPEYLERHQAKLAACGNVGFIAIDEAHHIGTEHEEIRPSYTRIDYLKQRFPGVVFLAVSATAPKPAADKIVQALGIEKVVVDSTMRGNLRVDDHRGIADKETYLASLAAQGEKMIIYVNSRQTSIDLARSLRKRLPEIASQIAFYNAGISREARLKIEELFRTGEITVIVATGAFGEGVNVTDIRHIALYHMPFSPLAYNQMSGRGGRDGKPAYVHLLFNDTDKQVNQRLLAQFCPPREQLVLLYKVIRQQCEGGTAACEDAILDMCRSCDAGMSMGILAVKSGIGIFAELGFVTIVEEGDFRTIKVVENASKMDLTESVRYREGRTQVEAFDSFADWLMSESSDNLLAGINRPLVPKA